MYALKMLSKALVLRTKQLDHILCEKRVLEELSVSARHPWPDAARGQMRHVAPAAPHAVCQDYASSP